MTNQQIEKVNFGEERLDEEYCDCTFYFCNFSNQDLAETIFENCRFEQCDFSLATPHNTRWDHVYFDNCKMLGIDFTRSNRFIFSALFAKCNLGYSLFLGMKLKGSGFKDCDLQEANFENADLSDVIFDQCELSRTVFMNTNLERVNFTTARNYTISPSQNRIKKARFSKEGLSGLLADFNIVIED